MSPARQQTYTAVAIILHWAIAVSIMTLIIAGWWMSEAIHKPETKALAFKVYQLHKSLGLTVLVLSILRLAWRLANPPPPLPAGMTRFERTAAVLTHAAFYVLMLAIPLAGWAVVSASPLGLPTIVFGLFEWPHIPMLADLADKKPAEHLFKTAHEVMAYGLAALLVLHVAAALKHHFVNRDEVLAHMLPFVRTRKSSIG